jgi:hypothetical protein
MYTIGSIPVVWDNEFKSFTYKKQPVTQEEINSWRAVGYDHNNFTGNLYDNKNPMPEWTNTIGNCFPDLHDKTFTIYRMDTLEIMPTHTDHFRRYCEIFNVDRENVRRVLVFLDDWKPGHYFEVAGKGVVNWKAGDYCMWAPEVDHAASNIGIEPRYTLQITGHV